MKTNVVPLPSERVRDIDREIRQGDPWIVLRNGRIIPFFDLAKEYADVGVAGKLKIFDLWQVVSDHDTARSGGDHHDALLDLFDLFIAHGGIARGEIYRALRELFHAGAGADGLVIYLNLGLLFVVFNRPALVQWRGERSACAGKLLGGGAGREDCRDNRAYGDERGEFHVWFVCPGSKSTD